MKTLIIVANPSKTSFSHAMAESYKTGAESRGDSVTMLDPYDNPQGFLEYESINALKSGEYAGKSEQQDMQKLLLEHDEYVFIFPVWWGNMPAILKNFFDCNFSAGFAFKFVSGKTMPQKLLTGKTAKIYTTCDAPAFLFGVGGMFGVNILKYLKKAILGFCGVQVTEAKLYGGISKKSDSDKQAILDSLSS